MHPPTPFPESARSRISVNKKEPPLDRPARTKGPSKSEHSPLPSARKGDSLTKRQNEKSCVTSTSRYSMLSKISSGKAESQNSISATNNSSSEMLSKRHGTRPTSISMTIARSSSDKTLQSMKVVGAKNRHTPNLQINSFHAVKKGAMTLKSAHYWIEQIKLAEEIQKHTVAITFFRLAVECAAEPKDLLKEELVAYTQRFSLCCDATKEVLMCYGIIDDIQESEISTNSDASDGFTSPYPHMARVEQSVEEKANAPEETSLKQKSEANHGHKEVIDIHGSPVLLGKISTMDVDTLTREVVSCIMSTIDCIDFPTVIENQMRSHVMMASPTPTINDSQGIEMMKKNYIEDCDWGRAEHSGSSGISKEDDANKKHCNQSISCNLEQKFISLEEGSCINCVDPNVSTCLSESSLCELNLDDGLENCEIKNGVTTESTTSDEKDADALSSCAHNDLKDLTLMKSMRMQMLKDPAINSTNDVEAEAMERMKSGISSCGAEGEGMESINEVIHSPTLATEPMLKQSIDFTPITSKEVVPSVRKRGKATLKQRNKSTANVGASEYPKKTTEEVASPSDKNAILDTENSHIFVATPESAGLRRSARLKATPAKITAYLRDTNTVSISTPRRRR